MRILQINKFHWVKGGSERYYFDLQRELAARGHEVAVFASAHPDNEPSPWSGDFAPHADYHGAGPLRSFGLARDVVHNAAAAAALERLLTRFRPDVAHLHNIHHQLSPSILEPLSRRGIPIVQTLHDYKWVCPAYLFHSRGEVCTRCGPGARFGPVLTRRCLHGSFTKSAVAYVELTRSWRRGDAERVDAFLAPSRFLLEQVVAHGLPADRVRHEPYFIREGDYRPAEVPGAGLLYAGRLAREKGLGALFAALARTAPGVRLEVAGGGPLEAELRREAAERRLPVTFLGHLAAPELHAAVRRARAVVVPSLWYENFPYAVLEALALGVPVVASATGGVPEMIEEGETGHLVPPGDPEALARVLDAVVARSAEAAAEMGRRARATLVERWGVRAGVARIVALYSEVSAARAASAAPRSASDSMPG